MHSQVFANMKMASGNSDDPRTGWLTPLQWGLLKATYDVNETLIQLSLGRTSLYELVKRGELKPIKFGKKTLFTAPDIAELLNKRRQASSDLSSEAA
jgi:predicted DNA-binding transcriptional regulator AlpA